MENITLCNIKSQEIITPRRFRTKTQRIKIGRMKPWVMRFKKRFDYLKAEEGLTQDSLAEAVGVTQPAVSHWLHGRRDPDTLEQCQKLADHLGVAPEWLYFGVGGDEPISSEAARFARLWDSLPPGERAAFRAAVESLAHKEEKRDKIA